MEFPELLKTTTAKNYSAWEAANQLSEDERKKKFSRHLKLETKYLEGLRKELHSGEISWHSDASKYVGGKGEYPGALQHFLAGLPLCQMTHYAERAAVWSLKIDSLEMKVTGHFIAIPGYGFEEIEYETHIQSSEPPEKIKDLVRAAESDCYVTNTLKHVCKLGGHIFLNGVSLMETHPA
jgi:uncharacterized OsmC-like protein